MKKITRQVLLISVMIFILLLSSCKEDPFEADSGTFIDKRDNHKYNWVKIGEQIWMAENLAYAPYLCAPDSQCGIWIYDYYGEGSYGVNYHIYGCLYDWETALEVCPDGWHLPSDEEWMELELFLGMDPDEVDRIGIIRGEEANVCGKLKETGFNHWKEPNLGATNEKGFTALPGGILLNDGRFISLHSMAYFWTSNAKSNTYSICRFAPYTGIDFGRKQIEKNRGLSIRCIKN